VTEPPETRFAETNEGASVAFQVNGEGPLDLLFMPGAGHHVELSWEMPALARLFRRLASFSRLIRFDERGRGLSDPLTLATQQPPLETRAKDILAVLDAAKSERAAVVANGLLGLLAIFFAATYPNRISALVLDGCYARLERAPDYPIGVPKEVLDSAVAKVRTGRTSNEATLGIIAPSAARNPEFVAQWERLWRFQSGPSTQRANADMSVSTDVRELLPSIQSPTLVLYRDGDRWVGRPHAEYLAEHISGATLVGLPGEGNLIFFGDTDPVIDEIEEFLTGARHAPETDRVLATVLFTDIVRSTERAAELGDSRWRDLLDSHDRTVRRQLDRFRGREINTAGDGFFATFEGPGRAIQCGCAIRDAVNALGIDIRVGLHTGEIEMRGNDAAGMAVHIGARVAALAAPGEVLVSGAIPPLVAGSGIEFEDRGEHELKGVPGTWRLYAVAG
jgi:class 3 adenylate cyclase/pimeloyl-ACP methyl ester carboxylesterase